MNLARSSRVSAGASTASGTLHSRGPLARTARGESPPRVSPWSDGVTNPRGPDEGQQARAACASAPLKSRRSSTIGSFDSAAASRQHGAFARAQPHVATVRRGDLLYLPLGWWHAVRGSQERNISVNFWFELHPSKRDAACPEEGGAAAA